MNTDEHRLSSLIRRTCRIRLALAVIASGCLLAALSAQEKTHKVSTVSLRKMADSVHAIIASDQQAYVELVTQSPAAGQKSATPPTHAQFLRHAAQAIQRKGAEFSYTLRSFKPIGAAGAPQTAAEQDGLEFVAGHAKENFYTEEQLGGRSYFTAVYAERASSASCVECHNQHSKSRDLKVGDVMGGIVVRVPLEF